ncbi:MAG: hypothetical protein PHY42_01230 [Bacilli bacterium]|nr:hypothetical protein [Bacilli bacterium]
MKTLMLLLLSFIFLGLPHEEWKTSFIEEVTNRYQEYVILDDYSSPYYHLTVVQGVYEDEVSLGICFFSETAKNYRLILEIGTTVYNLPQNNRGDISCIAMHNKTGMRIIVLDDASTIRRQIEVEAQSIETFRLTQLFSSTGQGEGGSFATLYRAITTLDLIIWISLGVMGVSSLILFILFKTKKGLFNPERRSVNSYHFSYLNQTPEEEPDEVEPTEESLREEENPSTSDTTFVNPYEELYGPEEEEHNIAHILEGAGVPSDYSLLTPQEKNETMLKLMYLRDKKEITLAEYQKEVIRLWKRSL